MSQPKGFVDNLKPNHVCELQKAIYGLKQSGREWYFEISKILKTLKFKRLESCNGVFHNSCDIVLLLYVDDIVILGKTENLVNRTVSLLKSKFDLKVIGKVKCLLGIDFEESEGNIFLSQERYINEIRERFLKCNPPISSLPIPKGLKYSKSQCPKTNPERNEMMKYPYRSLIGCLGYLAGRTRPDIAYAINIFSQFQENPGITHWNGLIKLLGYVVHSKDQKLVLSEASNLNVSCYSDSDFASNRDDRVSIGGLILFLDKAPIVWRTFKQKAVSLSSMEAEFISITESAKELVWITRILNECHKSKLFSFDSNVTLLSDSTAAIDFTNSPIENNRTKHIDVRLHFVRDLVADNIFKLKYIRSKVNLADPFTKPQTKEGLKFFKESVFNVNV